MSDGFAITVVSLLFAVFGIVVGFHLGDEAGARCENTARYATANVVAILVGSLLFMVVWATGYVVLGMFAFGAVAGAVAGLKFGYGESVGPWKFVDRLMTPAARQRDRERARVRRAAAKRARTGAAEPELMSVADAREDKQGKSAEGK
ncbi:hypothetical protein [Parolsenella catena]|uniref:hypothetical protein n=1 Tax=Parolsenella catena TaxID=2003188 RepID=UPI00189790E3|nr:hypothetical protein [Parolsenella catena]